MIELNINGMTCAHCVHAVTKALSKVPGVERVVEVSLDEKRARIEGCPDATKLVRAIKDEGYEAEVAGG